MLHTRRTGPSCPLPSCELCGSRSDTCQPRVEICCENLTWLETCWIVQTGSHFQVHAPSWFICGIQKPWKQSSRAQNHHFWPRLSVVKRDGTACVGSCGILTKRSLQTNGISDLVSSSFSWDCFKTNLEHLVRLWQSLLLSEWLSFGHVSSTLYIFFDLKTGGYGLGFLEIQS